MKLRVPRIPIVSTLALLLLITVLVLWIRSPRHADVVAFYTPTGHLDGLASDHGGMLFCASDIPFGREMGLTADAMSTSADEFAAIHTTLFDPSNEKWHFLGFRVAAGTLGTWGWKFNAILVPYWALLTPLAIPPMFGFRRVIRRARRKRRGQCLACGYDLRQSPERCPECGRPVGGIGHVPAGESPDAQARITVGGVIALLLLGAMIAAAASAVVRGRHAAATAATAPPESSVLNRPVGQFDVQGATLDDAVVSLVEASGVGIQLDGIDSLSSAAGAPKRVALRGVRFDTALRTLCDPPISSSGEALQLWADGPVVHVGLASQAPRVVRSYPVEGLLRPIRAELEREATESPITQQMSQTSQLGNQLFVSHSSLEHASAEETLATFFEDTVRPDDWADNGGKLGALTVAAGRLWVFQTQEGHADVRATLALLESPAAPAGAAATEPAPNPHANLQQRIPELRLDSTTLEGAIESLRQATHANIVVYWKQLEPAGLARDTPVKLHLWDVTLDQAIGAILVVAGGEHPGMRAVRDGIVVVGAPEEIRNGSVSVRVYGIRDLIEKYLTEGKLALSYPTTGPTNREQGAQPGTYQDTVDSIVRLIEDTVDTDSWKDNGGSVGALRELAGRLIVTQTAAGHRQIAALLRTLRTEGNKDGEEVSGNTRRPPNERVSGG